MKFTEIIFHQFFEDIYSINHYIYFNCRFLKSKESVFPSLFAQFETIQVVENPFLSDEMIFGIKHQLDESSSNTKFEEHPSVSQL